MMYKNTAKVGIVNLAGQLLKTVTQRTLPQTPVEWQSVNISYSQLGEDLLIHSALSFYDMRSPASYVDVGAFDPVCLSNTLRLYQQGWGGINIDPNPHNIAQFNRLRPNDINLEIAISEIEGEADFLIYESRTTSRLASTNDQSLESILGEPPQTRMRVRTLPLDTVLKNYLPPNRDFGLLNVDCEGADLEVLRSNDWSHFRPWIVAVEDHTALPSSATTDFMANHGYHLFAQAFITKIFVRSDLRR